MSRNRFESGYGTPFSPEIVGMAQTALTEAANTEQMPEGQQENELLSLENFTDEHVPGLRRVYDTGMVPPGFGVELMFETENGAFNSVASSEEQALREGVVFHLMQQREEMR